MSELGETLRQAREDKNISLEELAASTKIQKRYLQAIENGHFDQLPGRFYARAFVKSYAEEVGLNPKQLFANFPGEIPMTNSNLSEQLPPRSTRTRLKVHGSSKISSVLPKLLTAVFVIGLLFTVWIVVQHINSDPRDESSANDNNSSVELSENPEVGKADEEQPGSDEQHGEDAQREDGRADEDDARQENPDEKTSEQILTETGSEGNIVHYTLKNANEFQLELALVDGSSWIEVKKSGANGEHVEYATFREGNVITHDLTENDKIYVKIGSTPHVEMSINGEPFTYPSEKTVQTFLITYEKGQAS